MANDRKLHLIGKSVHNCTDSGRKGARLRTADVPVHSMVCAVPTLVGVGRIRRYEVANSLLVN